MAKRSSARDLAELRDLVERVRRANPTGRRCSAGEERVRYEEKARWQSVLIESYPHEVRARAHDDMPGVVSLSVPRLGASAAHAILEALSARARALLEGQLEGDATGPPSGRGRGPASSAGEGRLAKGVRLLAEYDFECAEGELGALARDGDAAAADRRQALVVLLELYVDRLADDRAALALEGTLRLLDGAPERAYELLGVAAGRAGEVETALRYLARCRGERAAEALAALAEAAAGAGAWGGARRAWGLLRALALPDDGPAPAAVRAASDRAGARLAARAAGARDEELEADAEFARFVRDFAPEHPWLDERRRAERQSRARAMTRSRIERAQALAREGDWAGVERALGALARAEGLADPADAARVEGLAAWAKARRTEALARRALASVAAGEFEAAARAFLVLPEPAREGALAADEGGFLAAVAALAATAPGGAAARGLADAAAAWAGARGGGDASERWRSLAPHAALLEGVPAFAAELDVLRECRPRKPRASGPPRPREAAGPREVWAAGLRVTELDAVEANGPGVVGALGVASCALRADGGTFVVGLDGPREGRAYDVTLWPIGGHAPPRRLRLEGAPSWRPREVLVAGPRVVIIDEAFVAWSIGVVPRLEVGRVELAGGAASSSAQDEMHLLDEGAFAVGVPPRGGAPARWAFLDVATGAALGEASGRGLYMVPHARGATLYRVEATAVERLDRAGGVVDRLELPRGVSPMAIVESPLGPSPIVLARSAGGPEVAVWWRAQEHFFRSFALFSAVDHGAFVEAVAFAGRALCVVSRRPDGAAQLHTAWAERGLLRPRRDAAHLGAHARLVVDPSGRRGWSARRDGGGLRLDPINLRPDDA